MPSASRRPMTTTWTEVQQAAPGDDAALLLRCALLGRAAERPREPGGSLAPLRRAPLAAAVAASAPRSVPEVPPVPDTVTAAPAPFCLHTHTTLSAAGSMCRDCGVVGLAAESMCHRAGSVPDGANRRQPVVDVLVDKDGQLSAAALAGPSSPPSSLQEWLLHVQCLQDQPQEVLERAYDIFRRVYDQQPIVGNKARALILVSLLYSSRLLYGNNRRNEEYLLCKLGISSRVMNKAFTSLAAVVHQPPTI